MAKAAAAKPPVSDRVRERQALEGEENLIKTATKRAQETGKPVDQELEGLKVERQDTEKEFEILFDTMPMSAFFDARMHGATKQVTINTDHNFFQQLYNSPDSTSHIKQGLQAVLVSIADCWLNSSDEAKRVYNAEMACWSTGLENALARLEQTSEPASEHDGGTND